MRDRLEAQLLETQKTSNELKAGFEVTIAEMRRDAAIAHKNQKAENTRLRAELQRYQFLDAIHIKARGPHPQYPARGSVPDEVVSMRLPFEGYTPTEFTHQAVVDNDVTIKPGAYSRRASYFPPSSLLPPAL